MARILVTEPIAEGGLDQLRAAGHDVDVQIGSSPGELLELVKGAQALIIRSATTVTEEVLAAGTDLVVLHPLYDDAGQMERLAAEVLPLLRTA